MFAGLHLENFPSQRNDKNENDSEVEIILK